MTIESRRRQLRAALTREYQQGAVNEGYVARLQAEFRTLPHGHRFSSMPIPGCPDLCMWCGADAGRN